MEGCTSKRSQTPSFAVESRLIGQVTPYAANPRRNTDAIVKVARSLAAFGWRQPIVVDRDGVVVVGHTRLEAARSLGMTHVPVHVAVELTPTQAKAYRLADNRTGEEATWNNDLLAEELRGLDTDDLAATGFDDDELAALLSPPSALLGDPDAVPDVPKTPITKPGDLITMGRHRLLCGDSTKAEDVKHLMGGEKAGLVFTDPPYGVDYDGGTVVREKLKGDDSTALYGPCCQMAADFSEKDAALYLWHAGIKGIAAAAAAAAAAAGYDIRCELVWNKNQAQFGALSAQYKQKHEPCYYCVRHGTPPRWFGPTNEVTVWDIDRASSNEFHPTQKPVALAARAITNSSKPGDVVLDLFAGSGSTMIAAQGLGRHARLLEIDPRYCDVIVTRWENATGLRAVRP